MKSIYLSHMLLNKRKSISSMRFRSKYSKFSYIQDPIKSTIWEVLTQQAKEMLLREPLLRRLIHESILMHDNFGDALIYRLATKLTGNVVQFNNWTSILHESLEISYSLNQKLDIERLALEDLIAIEERDPACRCIAQAFLYFKGFKALQTHRFAHILWLQNRPDLAHLLQGRSSEIFGVDIHPGASLGGGLMIDHATGVVIGETAVIGENCSMLHGVTLGGTGHIIGDRHPKIGNNVLIGCQATILGNIRIGNNCRIGSGTMILKPLPDNATAVGNPCRVILPTIHESSVNEDSVSDPQSMPWVAANELFAKETTGIPIWSHVWYRKKFPYGTG